MIKTVEIWAKKNSIVLNIKLEKEMAAHSSILAWRIPRTEVPGWLGPLGPKQSDMTEVIYHAHMHKYERNIHESILA